MPTFFRSFAFAAVAVSSIAATSAASAAGANTESGTFNGGTWTATSTIVGQRSTAVTTGGGGGNPGYLARSPRYRSTVGLLMEYANGDAFVCSGSLLSDRSSIVTAGHCVSHGAGTEGPQKVTAFFYDGNKADPFVYDAMFGGPAPGVTMVDVSKVFVNSAYTGAVIDQNDIAVLRLAHAPPKYATGYELYEGDELTGRAYNVAGYGVRSDVGGDLGGDLDPGRLRQGGNRYDFRFGDAAFEGFFTSPNPFCQNASTNFFCNSAEIGYSYLADFDSGLAQNDGSCLLAVAGLGIAPSSKFCDLGRGRTEVSTAGGDSGGPEFVDGKLASVTSYGLSFGMGLGDEDDDLNNSFGELNGFVPIFLHRDFIAAAVATPEPATWMMMIVGFGMVGGAVRRRTGQALRLA